MAHFSPLLDTDVISGREVIDLCEVTVPDLLIMDLDIVDEEPCARLRFGPTEFLIRSTACAPIVALTVLDLLHLAPAIAQDHAA